MHMHTILSIPFRSIIGFRSCTQQMRFVHFYFCSHDSRKCYFPFDIFFCFFVLALTRIRLSYVLHISILVVWFGHIMLSRAYYTKETMKKNKNICKITIYFGRTLYITQKRVEKPNSKDLLLYSLFISQIHTHSYSFFFLYIVSSNFNILKRLVAVYFSTGLHILLYIYFVFFFC